MQLTKIIYIIDGSRNINIMMEAETLWGETKGSRVPRRLRQEW